MDLANLADHYLTSTKMFLISSPPRGLSICLLHYIRGKIKISNHPNKISTKIKTFCHAIRQIKCFFFRNLLQQRQIMKAHNSTNLFFYKLRKFSVVGISCFLREQLIVMTHPKDTYIKKENTKWKSRKLIRSNIIHLIALEIKTVLKLYKFQEKAA